MPHTVLALHYWAGAGREFDSLRPLLSPDTALLAPNLPGFGGQPAPAEFDYSVQAYADWVAAYVVRHALTDFTLLGHSMGGKIALALAARRPAGLRRLVLLSPSPPAGEPMSDDDRTAALACFGKVADAEKTFDIITWLPLSTAIRQAVVADNLCCSHSAWNAWLIAGSREDISAQLPGLTVSCRLLVGEYDQAIPLATQRARTLPYLPAGTICQVVRAGHLLPLEVPALVAELVS